MISGRLFYLVMRFAESLARSRQKKEHSHSERSRDKPRLAGYCCEGVPPRYQKGSGQEGRRTSLLLSFSRKKLVFCKKRLIFLLKNRSKLRAILNSKRAVLSAGLLSGREGRHKKYFRRCKGVSRMCINSDMSFRRNPLEERESEKSFPLFKARFLSHLPPKKRRASRRDRNDKDTFQIIYSLLNFAVWLRSSGENLPHSNEALPAIRHKLHFYLFILTGKF